MSLIKVGIIFEIIMLGVVFLWVKQLNNKQTRQPSLSKKKIKNLMIKKIKKLRILQKKEKLSFNLTK